MEPQLSAAAQVAHLGRYLTWKDAARPLEALYNGLTYTRLTQNHSARLPPWSLDV